MFRGSAHVAAIPVLDVACRLGIASARLGFVLSEVAARGSSTVTGSDGGHGRADLHEREQYI